LLKNTIVQHLLSILAVMSILTRLWLLYALNLVVEELTQIVVLFHHVVRLLQTNVKLIGVIVVLVLHHVVLNISVVLLLELSLVLVQLVHETLDLIVWVILIWRLAVKHLRVHLLLLLILRHKAFWE
jgi:hypothetical protein